MNGYETQDRLTLEILKYIKALHILAAFFIFGTFVTRRAKNFKLAPS